jgi:phage tail protein X
LAAVPAGALELGDIQVDSTLGQPLRASIAYALGPNEQLYDFCIFLRPADGSSGIPSVTRARITVADGAIVLSGNVAVREPLLNLRLAVNCPYTPRLEREFDLMLNPGESPYAQQQPVAASTRVAANTAARVPAASTAPVAESRPRAQPGPAMDATPLRPGTSYRVRTGDTVSAIAARIEDRGVGLWPAVNAIVAANPGAFIGGDVNRLMAGSTLVIPDFTTAPAVAATAAAEPAPAAESIPTPAAATEAPPASGNAAEANASAEPAAAEPAQEPATRFKGMTVVGAAGQADETVSDPALPVPEAAASADSSPTVAASRDTNAGGPGTGQLDAPLPTAADPGAPLPDVDDAGAPLDVADQADVPLSNTDDLKPGDVVMPTEPPAARPNIPTVAPAVAPSAESGGNGSWLLWLAGAALAVLAAFFAFGRTLGERFRPAPTGRQAPPGKADDETTSEPTRENRVIEDLDFNFDDPVVANAMALDADLSDGSGLDAGDDIDVMQDFGFDGDAETGADVDHEISADYAREPAAAPTDVIPPSHRIEESSILESEVGPDALTGDYDLSMIVDATRQTIGDDDNTAQDLNAVPLAEDGYTVADDTLTGEVNMEVLQQDYEDELSATQALNIEIEKAASELADRLEDGELPGVDSTGETTLESRWDDATVEMPADDDRTAAMAASPDGYELTAADKTMEMPAAGDNDMTAELTANIDALNDEPANDSGTQRTIDVAAAGSDLTLDLEIESGKVDTKKK